MESQIKVVLILLLLRCVTSNEVSFLRNSNYGHARQYKNQIPTAGFIRNPTTSATSPIQYLETPNFDIMLLTEENSNPTWRKYADLFQPKDLTNVPHIEVNYGNRENFPYPFIDLDRSDIEAVLASLGDKKHIFVLHPRNCKPNSSSLDEFENEFLPKLLQKLHKPTRTAATPPRIVSNDGASAYNLDPVVDRILTLLDKDEQRILNDLRKTFEKPTYPTNVDVLPQRGSNPIPMTARNHNVVGNSRINIKKQESKSQIRDMLYKVPCNEGYVFLIESKKNPMNPNALSDLLMRVMKVVTKMS